MTSEPIVGRVIMWNDVTPLIRLSLLSIRLTVMSTLLAKQGFIRTL